MTKCPIAHPRADVTPIFCSGPDMVRDSNSGAAEYRAMCQARQEFNRRFAAWAETRPTPDDLTAEIDGTTGGIRGIARLLGAV